MNLALRKVFVGMAFFSILCGTLHAEEWGVSMGEKINVRDKPLSTGKVVGQIASDLAIIQVENSDCGSEKIKFGDKELECPWAQVSLPKLKTSYVFGNFIEVFPSKIRAENFVSENIAFRKKYAGEWEYAPSKEIEIGHPTITVSLKADGSLEMTLDAVEGDHLVMEKGTGRFYLYPEAGVVKMVANLKGEIAPDGMSWEAYYKLSTGHLPENKPALDAFIKERSQYQTRREFVENILAMETVLKKKQ